MSEKDYLLKEYENNINCAKDELSYHFAKIKECKMIIKRNQLLINAIKNYQLPISFL